jgi:hypothetical protein
MDGDGALHARIRQIAAELLSDGRAVDEPDAMLAAMWIIASADRLPSEGGGSQQVRKGRWRGRPIGQ